MASDEIAIERGGKTYKGYYEVSKGIVTVTTPMYGSKSTQVGNSPPATLARIMLRELIDEDEARERQRGKS